MNDDLLKAAFSARLRKRATEINMNYTTLAKYVGVGKTTMYNYFVGKRVPDVVTLSKICEILMVDPNYLMDFSSMNINSSFLSDGNDIYEQLE